MKKILSFFIIISIAVCFLFGSIKEKKETLPSLYKKLLEEEIVYIITPVEKEVFLKLKTDRERDLFIKAFWGIRDPNSLTQENEFKIEHYRRINHSNHFFGRATPRPGWRTDRGRIYIIMGEPNDIQRFEGKTTVHATEVWFYQGKTKLGLPPGFNLVFYQESFTGEYRLYSPAKDGPMALLINYYGSPMDYLGAYEQLREFEPELAEVSLSLIPGRSGIAFGRPSLSSDLLVQKVETTPVRQIKDKYARKFLEYKDIVEVEYSTNYIENYSLVKVVKDPSGAFFVHYAIEPERLSVNMVENKYYTSLKLNGTVQNLDGKTIYQFEKNISLDFDKEKLKSLTRRPFSIHDMFPLIPGNYKLSILVKNDASKEFTSLERSLVIPQDEEALQMTSLILGYEMKMDTQPKNRLRPFQIGPYRIYFQANRVFLQKDTLVVTLQIFGASQVLRGKGEIRFTFFKGGKEFRSSSKKIGDYLYLPVISEQFSLREFSPAHYRIQASLFIDGRDVLYESDEFDVTYLEAIARPWIYSKISPDTQNPIYPYLIGTQLFNSGKIEEARDSLERAFQKKPDSVDFALNLAQTYMVLDEYKKVESVLLPFLDQPEPPRYEIFLLMGKSYQNSGELSKAVDIFDKSISHYGLNINLLNSLGECYFQLGNSEEALAAWEKSLEINPNQPKIKKNVNALKGKK